MAGEAVLDARGLSCPLPVLKARKRLHGHGARRAAAGARDRPQGAGRFPRSTARRAAIGWSRRRQDGAELRRSLLERSRPQAAQPGTPSSVASISQCTTARSASGGSAPSLQRRAVDRELPVGAGAVGHDRAGALELGEAAQLGGVLAQQLDQLVDQLAHRLQAARGEVGELGLDAPALGAPFVLLDQDAAIAAASSGCGCAGARDGGAATGRGRRWSARPRRSVQMSVIRSSSVGCLAEGRMSHQIWVASSISPTSVRISTRSLPLAPAREPLGRAGARQVAGDRAAERLEAGVLAAPRRASWSTAPGDGAGSSRPGSSDRCAGPRPRSRHGCACR